MEAIFVVSFIFLSFVSGGAIVAGLQAGRRNS